MARIIPAPAKLLRPLVVPKKLMTGPGPSSASKRVLDAQAYPVIGHMHKEFFEIMDEIKDGIKYIFQTESSKVCTLPAGGNAGMEASAVNLLEPSDVALIGVNGYWGERFIEMVERNGNTPKTINRPYGEAFTLEDIEQGLKEHKPTILFLTHAESSAGILQPLEGVSDLCHKHNCLLVVDSVASVGGVPVLMDEWGIDYLYGGSQKAISAPPGVCPVGLSDRAWHKIANRKTKTRSFLLDIEKLMNYWGCNDQPRGYHHTTPVSTMFAFREALSQIAEEGLENVWKRHHDVCSTFQKEVAELGLEFLAKDPVTRLLTVTSIEIPDGINWKQVVEYANELYHMEIAGGLGSGAGKIWRIGLMGYNATPQIQKLAIKVLGEALNEARLHPVKLTAAQAKASW